MAKKTISEIKESRKEKSSSGASTPKKESIAEQVDATTVKINVDELRKHNVFFATPCYGGMLTDQYFLSMFRTQQKMIELQLQFRVTTLRNESLVTRARNILTAMFLESNCSHLMFIDADIEFDADSIIRMLSMDKEIIAGAYPKKTLPVQYAINFKIVDPATNRVNIDNGAVEVLDASTGFFMIKRQVFEKMMVHYPDLHYKNDSSIDPKFNKYCYAFFDTWLDPKDNRYLSEDYTFCRRWQEIGGRIWLDPNTKLNHVGSYTFEGDVSTALRRN
jgi:GT2 family glycosyltransferase